MQGQAHFVIVAESFLLTLILYDLSMLGWPSVMIKRSALTSGLTRHAVGGKHTINGNPNVAKLPQYIIELY